MARETRSRKKQAIDVPPADPSSKGQKSKEKKKENEKEEEEEVIPPMIRR